MRGQSTATPSPLSERFLEARTRAEARKREIDEEIRHYPTPIPRCDAQFNRLFAERDNLASLLENAKGIAQGDSPADGIEEWLAQFERAIAAAR